MLFIAIDDLGQPVRRSRWKRSDGCGCGGRRPPAAAGLLADNTEHGIAEVVGKHAAKARRRMATTSISTRPCGWAAADMPSTTAL